jgi:hypothetical protein
MERLKKKIEELYPYPVPCDTLGEIKTDRLRSAFREGLYFMLREIMNMMPTEDKTKSVDYNAALDELMDKYVELSEGIYEHYHQLHEEFMAKHPI